MKKFSIPNPCSENWNEMTPTEKGAFCDKCAHEVNDVTRMSNAQIRNLLIQNQGQRTCMRMTVSQEKSLDEEFRMLDMSKKQQMQRAMLFSLLVVFGFTLFSCTSPEQVSELQQLQQSAMSITQSEDKDETQVSKDQIEEEVEKNNTVELNVAIPDPVEPLECEIMMLGEPAIHTETLDSATIVNMPKRQYITMGITAGPALYYVDELPEDENAGDRSDLNLPSEFTGIAYPNPTIDQTTLKVELPEKAEFLKIWLLDMNGRKLEAICERSMEAGVHEFPVDLTKLKSGTYMASIQYDDKSKVVRIVKI